MERGGISKKYLPIVSNISSDFYEFFFFVIVDISIFTIIVDVYFETIESNGIVNHVFKCPL